jgi:hypothetical protein
MKIIQQISLCSSSHNESTVMRAALNVIPSLGGQLQLIAQKIDLQFKRCSKANIELCGIAWHF